MKITAITLQARNANRVNISVDGAYRFSLDIFQLGELGLKVGQEYSDEDLQRLEDESQFGKLYARAIEYCLARPHSRKEIEEYLHKKTLTRMVRMRATGEVRKQPGVSQAIAQRVMERLILKGYINDEYFAQWWVNGRKLKTGVSRRTMLAELRHKGVDASLAEEVVLDSGRCDEDELDKMIAKKYHRYQDQQKLIAYLVRQGFSYDLVRRKLADMADTK